MNEDLYGISDELEAWKEEGTLFNNGSIADIEAECSETSNLFKDSDFSNDLHVLI